MTGAEPLRAVLVDPSLFTAPYDAALTDGLLAAGVEPIWAVRPPRRGDRQPIASKYVDVLFYRHVDELRWVPGRVRAWVKGLAHGCGLARLGQRVRAQKPDIVHFQWAVIPALDALAMTLIRARCPVILTVHDTTPFNGDRLSLGQTAGYDLPMKVADHVIVHTEAARQALLLRGISSAKITVIPHGPLRLAATPTPTTPRRDDRYTFLLFGEIKRYKGIDVFVDALALLPDSVRARARFIVAGRPRMDLAPVLARIAELKIQAAVDLRLRRLSDQEVADLFAETDCFVFPYRQIDASGVYFLVKSLSKWLIASNVGIFAEDITHGVHGTLVAPSDPSALAAAMGRAIAERPCPAVRPQTSDWTTIGTATRRVYRQAQHREDRP
jgi:glycosyltransferase involved in cell wall biosynthesis